MATIKTNLQPFRIPNYVLAECTTANREDGYVDGPKFKLEEIDKSTLFEMCEDFKRGVLAKAGYHE